MLVLDSRWPALTGLKVWHSRAAPRLRCFFALLLAAVVSGCALDSLTDPADPNGPTNPPGGSNPNHPTRFTMPDTYFADGTRTLNPGA